MGLIQLRVDDVLKEQATEVFENLGLDLSSAIRMFLKRSVMENGIPFLMVNNRPSTKSEGIKALEKAQQISELNGNSDMSLDEINEIIMCVRQNKKQNK